MNEEVKTTDFKLTETGMPLSGYLFILLPGPPFTNMV